MSATLLSLALAVSVLAIEPGPPSRSEKLAALARLYGVVRWFHPTDAAQEIDWNRFAVHAAGAVAEAGTTEELERRLEELFAPVAVGLVIDRQLPSPQPAVDTSTAKLVAWRHLGLSGRGSGFSSSRTHRKTPGAIDGVATLSQATPALGLQGKTVRLSARVKAESTAPEGQAALWLSVKRGQHQGLFDNMAGRRIGRPEWREYAVEGRVDPDATELVFGLMALGPVRAGFDAVSLAVREADGSWRPLPVSEPGFEGEGHWKRGGTSQQVVVSYEQTAPPEGRRWVALSPPAPSDRPPFDAPLRAGAVVEFDLGLGLRARVPLVLTDAQAAVGAEQRRLLDRLRAELAALPTAGESVSPDVRAADVMVAWSVFRHFYPYWAEAGVDWDSRLAPLLEATAAAGSRQAQRDLLRRLAAEIRDGHAWVNDPQAAPAQAALPIAVRWLEGRLVVTASAIPDEVRPGDVIAAVDGRPAASWFAEQESLQSGSPQWRAQKAEWELVLGTDGGRVVLDLERDAGRTKVELTRQRREPVKERRPEPMAEVRAGVWYVDLERTEWAALEPRLADLAKARAVVFDMRGYPSDAGSQILAHLLAEPEHARWMHIPRIVEPFGRFAGWQSDGWDLKPAAPRIAGKVAFLVNRRAISYAESVMGYVEALTLGAIVGGPTAGTNGNSNSFMVPSGMTMAFTGMRVTRHDGSPFHLAGVRPTVPVEPTLAGIRAGRDEVLERALAIVTAER